MSEWSLIWFLAGIVVGFTFFSCYIAVLWAYDKDLKKAMYYYLSLSDKNND